MQGFTPVIIRGASYLATRLLVPVGDSGTHIVHLSCLHFSFLSLTFNEVTPDVHSCEKTQGGWMEYSADLPFILKQLMQ